MLLPEGVVVHPVAAGCWFHIAIQNRKDNLGRPCIIDELSVPDVKT